MSRFRRPLALVFRSKAPGQPGGLKRSVCALPLLGKSSAYTRPFTASAKSTGKADVWLYYAWLGFPVGVKNANGNDVLTGEIR